MSLSLCVWRDQARQVLVVREREVLNSINAKYVRKTINTKSTSNWWTRVTERELAVFFSPSWSIDKSVGEWILQSSTLQARQFLVYHHATTHSLIWNIHSRRERDKKHAACHDSFVLLGSFFLLQRCMYTHTQTLNKRTVISRRLMGWGNSLQNKKKRRRTRRRILYFIALMPVWVERRRATEKNEITRLVRFLSLALEWMNESKAQRCLSAGPRQESVEETVASAIKHWKRN